MNPCNDSERAPSHACVSWTYVGPERAEEALLRIRRLLKEHEGWWTEHDEHLEREAFARLAVVPTAALPGSDRTE